MMHICVISSHKPIRIYMPGSLILGVNTLYRLYCFFKLFPMVGKGLKEFDINQNNSTIDVWDATCVPHS